MLRHCSAIRIWLCRSLGSALNWTASRIVSPSFLLTLVHCMRLCARLSFWFLCLLRFFACPVQFLSCEIHRPFHRGLPSSIPKDSTAYLTGVGPEDGTWGYSTGVSSFSSLPSVRDSRKLFDYSRMSPYFPLSSRTLSSWYGHWLNCFQPDSAFSSHSMPHIPG